MRLLAISQLDGRYRNQMEELIPIVSEYGLIKTRIEVESAHLIQLCKIGSPFGIGRQLGDKEQEFLRGLGPNLTLDQAEEIKRIEDETNHDVTAMVRAYRGFLRNTSLEDITELVHWPLTSEDVNNIAYRLMLKRARNQVMVPALDGLVDDLVEITQRHKGDPMLARTHGQGAVGTTLGHEMAVFAERLNTQVEIVRKQKLTGKFNGAVGIYNAHILAAPEIDWIKYSRDLVRSFGLKPRHITTQINPYDDMVEMFQTFQRINGIVLDFDQDMWRYISDDWFIQERNLGEDGSSTMAQKINPIYFERSEGNLSFGNWILTGMSDKLLRSRLQRDLSDSTVIRGVGLALGFSLLGFVNSKEGLRRVYANTHLMEQRLASEWSTLVEGAQVVMRRAGVKNVYDFAKDLFKGVKMDQNQWLALVDSVDVDEKTKKVLKDLTPITYVGLAQKIAGMAAAEILKSRGRRNENQ